MAGRWWGALVVAALAATGSAAPHSRAELISSVSAFASGQGFDVGLRITPDPGWHFYWINPGDSGMPVEVAWRLPEGWSASPIAWPTPRRFDTVGIASFGFDEATLMPIRLTPPADWRVGTPAHLVADVTWMVCRESCVPAAQMVRLTLPSAPQARPATGAASIAAVRAALPVSISDAGFSVDADGFALTFTHTAARPTVAAWDFFASDPATVDHARPVVRSERVGNGWSLVLRRSEFAPATPPTRLRGVAVPLDAEGRRIGPGFAIDASPNGRMATLRTGKPQR